MKYVLTMIATGVSSLYESAGEAMTASGVECASESGAWMADGSFRGGYDDGGSDAFAVRAVPAEAAVVDTFGQGSGTLDVIIWASEADAEGDDGARAIARYHVETQA